MKEAGNCTICGQPLNSRSVNFCSDHLLKRQVRSRLKQINPNEFPTILWSRALDTFLKP